MQDYLKTHHETVLNVKAKIEAGTIESHKGGEETKKDVKQRDTLNL